MQEKTKMNVRIRKFTKDDIPLKVKWINDERNNQFLHYDLPLTVEKTEKWFESHIGDKSRFDATIEADEKPCGTIGLLAIDRKNGKAEYYIALGEPDTKGKGIALKASELLLEYAFQYLNLHRIYLYTETENLQAQYLFEKIGFVKEGYLKDDILSHGKYVDRYIYGICKADYLRIYKNA